MPSLHTALLPVLWLHLTAAKLSVMYAHDKTGDMAVTKCVDEMFPQANNVDIQESDEPCIFFCVLKKFGIMNSNGYINLEAYRRRALLALHSNFKEKVRELGNSCIDRAEATTHKQDVCKKAQIFNDCTRLYKIVF